MKLKNKFYHSKLDWIVNNSNRIALYQDMGLNSHEYSDLQYYLNGLNLNNIRIKNKITKNLLLSTKYRNFGQLFEGSCILFYSSIDLSSDMSLFNIHSKFPKLLPLGGILEDYYMTQKQFIALNDLNTNYTSIFCLEFQLEEIPSLLSLSSKEVTYLSEK